MARTPQQLLENLTREQQKLVDELEESIDRAMDRGYAGGEFKYRHGGRLPPAVIGELRRRYSSWLLAVRLDGCPDEDGTDTILAFKPGRAVPPQGDSGTDGPWLGSNPWE